MRLFRFRVGKLFCYVRRETLLWASSPACTLPNGTSFCCWSTGIICDASFELTGFSELSKVLLKLLKSLLTAFFDLGLFESSTGVALLFLNCVCWVLFWYLFLYAISSKGFSIFELSISTDFWFWCWFLFSMRFCSLSRRSTVAFVYLYLCCFETILVFRRSKSGSTGSSSSISSFVFSSTITG